MLKQLTILAILAGTVWAGDAPLPAAASFYVGQKNELKLPWPTGATTARAKLFYLNRCVQRTEIAAGKPLILQFEAIKPGLVAETKLHLEFANNEETISETTRPILFFSKDHLKHQQKALKELNIGVYGSEEAVKRLMEFSIPCEKTERVDGKRKWLILRGINFDKQPGLLQQCLNGDASILVLPPFNGTVPFPFQDATEFQFAGNEQAANLLQASHRFKQAVVDGKIGILLGETGKWSWMHCRFPKTTVVFCGWDLIGQLPRKPAALRLLELILLNNEYLPTQGEKNE